MDVKYHVKLVSHSYVEHSICVSGDISWQKVPNNDFTNQFSVTTYFGLKVTGCWCSSSYKAVYAMDKLLFYTRAHMENIQSTFISVDMDDLVHHLTYLCVLILLKDTIVPRESPCIHRENMQSSHRYASTQKSTQELPAEAVLTMSPPCCPYTKLVFGRTDIRLIVIQNISLIAFLHCLNQLLQLPFP